MIIDHYKDRWGQPYRPLVPWTIPPQQFPLPPNIPTQKEVDEFHELLRKAREYDKNNNQPDCEMESKKKQLLELAEQLGIKISFDE